MISFFCRISSHSFQPVRKNVQLCSATQIPMRISLSSEREIFRWTIRGVADSVRAYDGRRSIHSRVCNPSVTLPLAEHTPTKFRG